jgi:hypothetical protein
LVGMLNHIDKYGLFPCENAPKVWEPTWKTISERGWGPLTYNVLLHPEIQTTSRTNLKPILEVLTAATTNTLLGELNLRSGLVMLVNLLKE